MGIYKVIQIKIPNCLQSIQKNKVKKKQKRHTGIKHRPYKSHCYPKRNRPAKKYRRLLCRQTAVLLFLLLLLAKGFSMWKMSPLEQTAEQTDFFLNDSLPY